MLFMQLPFQGNLPTEDSGVHSSARCQDFHHDSQSHFTDWCGRLQWVLPILLPNEKTLSSFITNKQENISLQYRLLHLIFLDLNHMVPHWDNYSEIFHWATNQMLLRTYVRAETRMKNIEVPTM